MMEAGAIDLVLGDFANAAASTFFKRTENRGFLRERSRTPTIGFAERRGRLSETISECRSTTHRFSS